MTTSDTHDNGREEQWRYEIRGSQLYDLIEKRPVSIFEAGEILNAHHALLIRSGIWAGKAGLAQAKVDKLSEEHEAHASFAAEMYATVANLRTELEAARAQAGLAQRLADDMRERGRKAQFNNPTLSPRAALAFALTGAEWEWLAEFDTLAAGPTAAAEVNDGE